jgi:hypothetical protein
MLPIKLFWLVFCLIRFNRNIETLCFDIEADHQIRKVAHQRVDWANDAPLCAEFTHF